MKINSTSTCISLILHALQKDVVPATTDKDAQATLGMIQVTLIDILKRQGPATAILQKIIQNGEALEQEIIEHLDQKATLRDSSKFDYSQLHFDHLVGHHGDLTSRLDNLGRKLSEQSAKDPAVKILLRRLAEWEMEYYKAILPVQVAPFGDDPAVVPSLYQQNSQPLTAELLQAFLESARTMPVEVVSFSPITGGFGKQTFRSTIKQTSNTVGEDGQNKVISEKLEHMIIRKGDPHPIMLHSTFRLEQEYHLLQSLSKTDFPCPRPIELGLDIPGIDGTFFTMEVVPGTIPRPFLDNGSSQTVSETVVLQLAELLAKLHAFPLETFEDYILKFEDATALQETTGERYRRNLRGWREYVEKVEHIPSPYITWLFHWLENNIPEDSRKAVLTHGDFAIHNVLVVDDRITGVLDWECADFGAPEQDLAYIKPHVVKYMDWEEFLDHYKASGGQEVDQKYMAFCAAYSVLRTFLGGIRGTQNIQRGLNRDLRYVMVEYGFAPMFMGMGLQATSSG